MRCATNIYVCIALDQGDPFHPIDNELRLASPHVFCTVGDA